MNDFKSKYKELILKSQAKTINGCILEIKNHSALRNQKIRNQTKSPYKSNSSAALIFTLAKSPKRTN